MDATVQPWGWPLDPEIPLCHKLWLQLLQELLHEPISRQIGFPPWRGVVGTMRHLQLLTHIPEEKLKHKRISTLPHSPSTAVETPGGKSRQEPSTHKRNPSLLCLEECLHAVAELKRSPSCEVILKRVRDAWVNPDACHVSSLSASLWFAFEQRHSLRALMVEAVRSFLDPSSEKDMWHRWPQIEVFSRSLLLDVLELGTLTSEDLVQLPLFPRNRDQSESAVQAWIHLLENHTTHDLPRCDYEALLTSKRPRVNRKGPDASGLASTAPHTLSLTGISLTIEQVTPERENTITDPGDDGKLKELKDVGEDDVHLVLSGSITAHTQAQMTRLLQTHIPGAIRSQQEGQGQDWQVDHLQLFSTPRLDAPVDEDISSYSTLPPAGLLPIHDGHRQALPEVQTQLRTVGLLERCGRATSMLVTTRDRRPIEQLARCWSALEQLVSFGKTDKGLAPIRAARTVLVLHHLLKTSQQLLVDVRYALGVTLLFERTLSDEKTSQAEKWLGSDGLRRIVRQRESAPQAQRGWLVKGGKSASPFIELTLGSRSAVRCFLENRDQSASLQEALTPIYPRLSYRLTLLFDLLGYDVRKKQDRKAPMDRKHALDALVERLTVFLLFCYDLRNQHVHEADHFHKDEDPRVQRYVSTLHGLLPDFLASTQRRLQVLGEGVPGEVVWESFGEQYNLIREVPIADLASVLPQIFRDCSEEST